MEGGNVANGASTCFISNVFFKLAIINATFFSLLMKRAMLFVFRPTKLFAFLYINNKCVCHQNNSFVFETGGIFCDIGNEA